MARESLVVWIKPDGFFYVGDSCFWLTQPHHCLPKLEKCAGITAIERNRCLELHLCFAQSVLYSPEYPHRNMRHRAVRIALESFEEQLFGPCLILLRRGAPSEAYIAKQGCCDADLRIDGSRGSISSARSKSLRASCSV